MVIGSAAVIGNGVKIQNNVSIYDAVTIEDGVFCGPSMVFTNVINPRSEIVRKNEYRPTLIRHGATLGANSTIVCGHTVGRYAFIAAGAVVAGERARFRPDGRRARPAASAGCAAAPARSSSSTPPARPSARPAAQTTAWKTAKCWN